MKRVFVVLIILCSIHFWGWIHLTQTFHNLTNLISLGIMGFCMAKTSFDDGMRFKYAIFLYLIGIVLNIISAKINNGQGVRDTALSLYNYYFIILYFFLHNSKVSRKDLEIIVLALAVLYSFFYLRQEDVYPERLFAGNMFVDRGTVRIRIEGSGFLTLGYFMLLNRFLLERKIWQIALALIFFVVVLKGGFRSLTAGVVLLSGITFLALVKYSPKNYVMIILATVLLIGVLQLPGYNYIITNMIETTQEQQEEGEDYIRHQQYEYFSTAYPKNFSYYVIGGGLPGAYGAYAQHMGLLVEEYGFYWVDLGLIGFYYVIGLIALLGILAYTLKAIFIRIPPDCFYLHAFFAYLLLVSFTTAEIFRPGMFAVEAIALYLIDLGRDKYENTNGSSTDHIEILTT